jgi:protoporphyrinogen IX oxidase
MDVLGEWYLWIKSLHIIAVVAWMAGLFYLPRLFVYHAEQGGKGPVLTDTLEVMERRLEKAIMVPAMIATWFFGILLVLTPGLVDWSMAWAWVKAGSVLGMTVFQFWLSARRREFSSGENRLSGRAYRMMNEVPTMLLIVIVFAVVMKF